MNIYLMDEHNKWRYFEDCPQEELIKRGIRISSTAYVGKIKIGNWVSIGYKTRIEGGCIIQQGTIIGEEVYVGLNTFIEREVHIGHNVYIGDNVYIGNNVYIDGMSNIGHWVYIGDMVKIGYRTNIGNHTYIWYGVNIGNEVVLDDNSRPEHTSYIGSKVHIRKYNNISALSVLVGTGIDISSGKATFYKTVNPDLTSFDDDDCSPHQYEIGGSNRMDLPITPGIACWKGFYFSNIWKAIEAADKRPYTLLSATIKLSDICEVWSRIRCRAYSDIKIVKIEGLC